LPAALAARTTPVAAAAAPATCPPPGFDSLPDFDLPRFVAAGPWYALEQNEVFYQRKSDLFCVRAVYTPRNPADLSAGLVVRNTARRGSVTGAEMGSSAAGGGFAGIVAFPDTTAAAKAKPSTAASKLRVLPSFLEPAFRLKPSSSLISGPYWIVAAARDMSWALISGGPPTNPSNGACRTGRAGAQTFLDINGSGLWVFAREPLGAGAAQAKVEARAAAQKLGYDLSTLLPVEHEGCVYPSAA
jgi:lipocalin